MVENFCFCYPIFLHHPTLDPILAIMSQQGRKEEAAATQDLPKLDAARVRKEVAAQSRKDAAAPKRKARGRARVALQPEQSSSSLAAHVPEQRSAATAPRSFTDSSFLLQWQRRRLLREHWTKPRWSSMELSIFRSCNVVLSLNFTVYTSVEACFGSNDRA